VTIPVVAGTVVTVAPGHGGMGATVKDGGDGQRSLVAVTPSVYIDLVTITTFYAGAGAGNDPPYGIFGGGGGGQASDAVEAAGGSGAPPGGNGATQMSENPPGDGTSVGLVVSGAGGGLYPASGGTTLMNPGGASVLCSMEPLFIQVAGGGASDSAAGGSGTCTVGQNGSLGSGGGAGFVSGGNGGDGFVEFVFA